MKKVWIFASVACLFFACGISENNEQTESPIGNIVVEEAAQTQKKEPQTVEDYEGVIKNDAKWLESVTNQAKEKGISVDEAVKLNAEWVFNEKRKNSPEAQIEKLVIRIKADSLWMYQIGIKAEKRNVSIEEMISDKKSEKLKTIAF